MTIDPTLLTLLAGAIAAVFAAMSAVIIALWVRVKALEDKLQLIMEHSVTALAAEAMLEGCPAGEGCPLYRSPAPKLGHPGLASLATLLLLPACTMNPIVFTDGKGRDAAWLGGSLGTKADYETASITRPDGTTITHSRHGKDEVAIPRAYMQAKLGEALGRVAGSVTKHSATQQTKQLTEQEVTKRTAITAPLDAQTEQARIAAEAAATAP